MKLPPVSIIVTTKNEEDNIRKCLESMFAQTYPKDKLEIVVVDNFSTDKTPQIVKKFPIKFFQRGPERHVQRNFGVKKSNGKYLMFIDADMRLQRGLVKEAVGKCEAKGYDALILPERAGGGGFWAECQKLEKKCYLEDLLMEAPNRFVKKSAYNRVGGYDKNIVAGEDFDLGDRIKKAGLKIGRTESLIIHYEETSFWPLVKKKFYYGSQMAKYFKKSGVVGIKRFSFFRPAYFRNWRLFLKNPFHGTGLIFMKTSHWIAGSLGLLIAFLKKDAKYED